MTQDEIIRMAREAEFEIEETRYGLAPCVDGRVIRCNLERFAALVAESERQWFAQIINRIAMPTLTRELILDVLKARQGK